MVLGLEPFNTFDSCKTVDPNKAMNMKSHLLGSGATAVIELKWWSTLLPSFGIHST
jgi:hypothetical protein